MFHGVLDEVADDGPQEFLVGSDPPRVRRRDVQVGVGVLRADVVDDGLDDRRDGNEGLGLVVDHPLEGASLLTQVDQALGLAQCGPEQVGEVVVGALGRLLDGHPDDRQVVAEVVSEHAVEDGQSLFAATLVGDVLEDQRVPEVGARTVGQFRRGDLERPRPRCDADGGVLLGHRRVDAVALVAVVERAGQCPLGLDAERPFGGGVERDDPLLLVDDDHGTAEVGDGRAVARPPRGGVEVEHAAADERVGVETDVEQKEDRRDVQPLLGRDAERPEDEPDAGREGTDRHHERLRPVEPAVADDGVDEQQGTDGRAQCRHAEDEDRAALAGELDGREARWREHAEPLPDDVVEGVGDDQRGQRHREGDERVEKGRPDDVAPAGVGQPEGDEEGAEPDVRDPEQDLDGQAERRVEDEVADGVAGREDELHTQNGDEPGRARSVAQVTQVPDERERPAGGPERTEDGPQDRRCHGPASDAPPTYLSVGSRVEDRLGSRRPRRASAALCRVGREGAEAGEAVLPGVGTVLVFGGEFADGVVEAVLELVVGGAVEYVEHVLGREVLVPVLAEGRGLRRGVGGGPLVGSVLRLERLCERLLERVVGVLGHT